MRIDRLEIENFKKFAKLALDLHPQFTLLVGDNGSGKTSLLDALAVAAGIWLVKPPDSTLNNSRRSILSSEIRLEPVKQGDRLQFMERRPVVVRAKGKIGDLAGLEWTRQIRRTGSSTSNAQAQDAMAACQIVWLSAEAINPNVPCPVLAYYGAGRAWLPSNYRTPKVKPNGPARRWAAFYDCFAERIRFAELHQWFSRETTERGNRSGRWRPGFEVVRRAVLHCVPEADDVWFDPDRDQIVLSLHGEVQPFDNLSAGQRMMLALVADLAIKAVTQNAYLLPPDELGAEDTPWPRVLAQTPGLVLIDELDVHLHPRWQRRVASDLKATFPAMQFVCTSHSPQVIGEAKPEEIRVLGENLVTTPPRSYGIDSSRILEEVMAAAPRNESVGGLLAELSGRVDREDFAGARELLGRLETELGADDPEITRARTLLAFLESKA